MKPSPTIEFQPIGLKKYYYSLIVAWTLIIAALLDWSLVLESREVFEAAQSQASILCKNGMLLLFKNGVHRGGRRASQTQSVPADDNNPAKDNAATSGSRIALPSLPYGYVSRQILETNMNQLGIAVRLVGLRPLCPLNVTDPWEAEALRSLNKNNLETSAPGVFNRETCIRLIHALPAEASCLKCHGVQGFKLGDVIGGLDITYTMAPLWKSASKAGTAAAVGYGLLWVLGIAGIHLAFLHVRCRLREREQVERELQHERDFSSAVIETAGALVVVLDPQGGIVRFNRACERATGYSFSEVEGRPFWDLLLQEEIEPVKKVFEDLIAGQLPASYVNCLVTKDETHRLIAWTNTILTNAEGLVVYVIGTGIDITERQQAEAALRQSEERYRQIVETANEGIWMVDAQERTTFVNTQAAGMLGYTREEMLGTLLFDYMDERVQAIAKVDLERRHQGLSDRRDFQFRHKDGSTLWAIVSAAPHYTDQGQYCGAIAMITDITDRKRAEKALKNSERRLSEIINFLPDATFVADEKGCIVAWNRAMEELTGITAEAIIGKGDQEYAISFYGERRPMLIDLVLTSDSSIESYYARINHKEQVLTTETFAPSLKPGGAFIWSLATPLYDAQGNINGAIQSVRDITERRLAEQALRRSEEKFRDLFETCRDAIFIAEVSTGRLVDVNEAACRLIGLPKENIIGMHQSALHPPDEAERYKALFTGCLNSVSGVVSDVFVQNIHGERIPVEISTSLLATDDHQFVQGVFRDVTERKRLEEERQKLERQIQHAQKLESLGVLAGGIAHDFNNLLMGMLGYADLALIELAPEAPARSSIQQIETAALRAAELTKQMLAYSGKGKFVIQQLNLSKLVEEMAHLLQVTISKKIVLRYHFNENSPSIEGDATQIRQVVMNLITNASDAIGDNSGMITISTGVMEVDRDYLQDVFIDGEIKEGFYTYVEVSDTGCGMDTETKSKIFDPFFTTKFTGRGLGLAAVLGIVRGHFGGLKVCSEPGCGTTFKVLFPCIRHSQEPVSAKTRVKKNWQGSGSILIVDDEETVRAVGKMTLERAGFNVLIASDGREGVQVFRERAHEIILVLLDMTMPCLSGEEAFREMRRTRPDARIILSSGYNEKDATHRFAGKGLAGFIQKPYRPGELIEMVSSLLQGES